MKNSKNLELDKKNYILKINDTQIISKIQDLGGLLYDENKLTFLEAIYFTEKGVLELDKDELWKFLKKDKLAQEKYAILRYFRDNGFIARLNLEDSAYFRVYQKGFRPGEDRTKYLVKVIDSSGKAKLSDIEKEMEIANNLRKELVLAYVDKKNQKPIFVKISRTSFQ
ncbi:MAG: hypothetical protein AABX38_06090 [Candidatus Micrarchaeota archaeon]